MDDDCGTDGYTGNKYCVGDDVYQDYINYECEGHQCSSTTEQKLIEECSDTCSDGQCVERECTTDNDCSEDYYGDKYCIGKEIWNDYHDFSCENNICQEEIKPELIKECQDGCENGECITIECEKNSDCGTNNYTGDKYCGNDNNVYQDYKSHTCNNPKTKESYCTSKTSPILIEHCEGNCLNGECVNCFTNTECGTDGFIGEKYCIGKEIWQDYQQFQCVMPGTPDSNCQSSAEPKFIEECEDECFNGQCREIECYDDGDCDDGSSYTVDECNNPGTADSYCTNTEVNCVTDNDCGTTGFFGQEYCKNNDLFKNYRNSTCNNPGTKESYCTSDTEETLVQDCGEDTCTQWEYYCKGEDKWKKRTCTQRGCDESCYTKKTTQDILEEENSPDCISYECTVDDDCGTDYYGENYCKNDDSYKEYHDFSCVNNKCNEEITEIREECGEDTCTEWEYYCKQCTKELWRERTCTRRGCENKECYEKEVYENELYEKCDFFCWNGECMDYCWDRCGWGFDCEFPDCEFDWNYTCDLPGCDFNWNDWNMNYEWNYSC